MTGIFDSTQSQPASIRGGKRSRFSLRGRRAKQSSFAESTLQEVAWKRRRGATSRWAIGGGVVGALIGLVAFAPAAWLAQAVATISDDRVLLSDARGTIWNGDAQAVLTAGLDSRSASALPGRVAWKLRPALSGLTLQAVHDCCLQGTTTLRITPGFGRVAIKLEPTGAANQVGQWPAAWLAGLGTPWNTLQLGGTMRLASPGFTVERVQGRLRFQGEAMLDVNQVSSRISTLPSLGSYRLQIRGVANNGGTSSVQLSTLKGPLQLTGNGQWAGAGLRFTGEAKASEGQEEALANLLNIIGRRKGAVSVISIG
jgi:general secretion pathway protein N